MDADSLGAFERAAEGVQSGDAATRTAAESVLLALRESPTAVASSQAVLAQTSSAVAQFQALLALKEGVLREWGTTAPQQVDALRTQLLEFTVDRWDTLAPFVRSQLLVLVALILKRAWLDEGGDAARTVFFEQAKSLLEAGGERQSLACRLLLALTNEFSFGKFTSVGLAWEFHIRSRAVFQQDALQQIFVMAVELLKHHAGAGAAAASEPSLEPCLQLATAVLSWDFAKADAVDTALSGFFRAEDALSGGGVGEVRALKPTAAWRGLLLQPQLAEIFFALASGTDRADGVGLLCESARQSLICLAGLEGVGEEKIFGDSRQKMIFLSTLLSRSLSWLREGRNSAPSADLRGAELFDGCQLLFTLLSGLSSGRAELQSMWSPEDTAGLLSQLMEVTEELLSPSLLAEGEDALEGWLGDAVQLLLHAWCCLIPYGSDSALVKSQVSTLESVLPGFTPRVFELYLAWRLSLAQMKPDHWSKAADEASAASRLKEEAEEDEESEVHLAATLARFDPSHSLLLLKAQLEQATAGMSQGAVGAAEQATVLLELAKFTLCDNGHGEIPTVPTRLHAASKTAAATGATCGVAALVAGMRGCCTTLQAAIGAGGITPNSPINAALVELLEGFGRLAPTYLTLERSAREYSHVGGVSPALLQAFGLGNGGDGPALVAEMSALAVSALATGGAGVAPRAAVLLLLRLARLKSLRAGLVAQPAWSSLLQLVCTHQAAIVSLPTSTKRLLGEALCCAGLSSPQAAVPYMTGLHGAISVGYQALLGSPEFGPAVAADPEGPQVEQALHFLSLLRGIARVSEPGVGQAVYGGFAQVFPLGHILVANGFASAALVPSLCKLLGSLIEGYAMCMAEEESGPLFAATVETLSVYHLKRGAVLDAAAALVAAGRGPAASELKYKHVMAVLGLLNKLQDALFSVSPDVKDQLVALIFHGLQIAVTFVDAEMLAYPKLCEKYLFVVSQSVDSEPAKVIELPPELFSTLMSSLEYGLDSTDAVQAGNCVYAIYRLAKHVYDKQQCGGGASAAALASDGQHSAALVHFLEVLLDKLLFKDFAAELVDAAADLALALILCYEQLFGTMVQKLVESRPAEEQARLNSEFGALMTTNNVTKTLGVHNDSSTELSAYHPNRTRFRKNMLGFLTSVRGFLQKK